MLLVAYCSLLLGCGGGGQQTASSSPDIMIAISPSTANILAGQSQQMVATITGTSNNQVAWSVNGLAGGNPALGTVSTSGLYLAPASIPAGGTVSLAAVSVADASKAATAVITIHDSIALTPTSATVAIGSTQQFTATVNGLGSSAVQWMVNGIAGGNAATGIITLEGVYAAPAVVPTSSVLVAAVDVSDSQASANASVTVVNPAVLAARTQWLAGIGEAAASYGCTDISVQQGSSESIADAVNRFGLTAGDGACLILWPISTDPDSIRYSLAWGGTVDGKQILYVSDVGRMRIWNSLEVASY